MSTEPTLKINALRHNLSSLVRSQQVDGKDYFVVPTVLIREGTFNAVNYRANDLSKFPEAWNGRPLVVQHPERHGRAISAGNPQVMANMEVGRLFNTEVASDLGPTKNKVGLRGEMWIEKDKCAKVSPLVLEKLQNNEPLEVSTGLFTEDLKTPGVDEEGRRYTCIATKYRPDHLAILPEPGQVGACSWEDGAGGPRLNEQDPDLATNDGLKINPEWVGDEDVWEQAKTAALKTYAESDDNFYPVVTSIYKKMGGTVKPKTNGGVGSGVKGHTTEQQYQRAAYHADRATDRAHEAPQGRGDTHQLHQEAIDAHTEARDLATKGADKLRHTESIQEHTRALKNNAKDALGHGSEKRGGGVKGGRAPIHDEPPASEKIGKSKQGFTAGDHAEEARQYANQAVENNRVDNPKSAKADAARASMEAYHATTAANLGDHKQSHEAAASAHLNAVRAQEAAGNSSAVDEHKGKAREHLAKARSMKTNEFIDTDWRPGMKQNDNESDELGMVSDNDVVCPECGTEFEADEGNATCPDCGYAMGDGITDNAKDVGGHGSEKRGVSAETKKWDYAKEADKSHRILYGVPYSHGSDGMRGKATQHAEKRRERLGVITSNANHCGHCNADQDPTKDHNGKFKKDMPGTSPEGGDTEGLISPTEDSQGGGDTPLKDGNPDTTGGDEAEPKDNARIHGKLKVNDLSVEDIRTLFTTALDDAGIGAKGDNSPVKSSGPTPWVTDVFPEENYFVYCFDGKTFKQPYKLDEDNETVALVGKPVKVVRRTVYTPVKANATTIGPKRPLTPSEQNNAQTAIAQSTVPQQGEVMALVPQGTDYVSHGNYSLVVRDQTTGKQKAIKFTRDKETNVLRPLGAEEVKALWHQVDGRPVFQRPGEAMLRALSRARVEEFAFKQNYGTSEGAIKGWETRRGGSAGASGEKKHLRPDQARKSGEAARVAKLKKPAGVGGFGNTPSQDELRSQYKGVARAAHQASSDAHTASEPPKQPNKNGTGTIDHAAAAKAHERAARAHDFAEQHALNAGHPAASYHGHQAQYHETTAAKHHSMMGGVGRMSGGGMGPPSGFGGQRGGGGGQQQYGAGGGRSGGGSSRGAKHSQKKQKRGSKGRK